LGRAIAKIWRGHLTTLPENLHTMKLAVNGAELEVNHRHESWLNRELFETAYGRLQHMDLPLRDVDDAWDRLQRLRTVYGVQLQSLCRSSTLRSSLHPVPGLTPAARWPIASGQADSSRTGRRCPDRLSGGAGWILGSLGGVALAHRWRRFQQHQQSRLIQRQFCELGS